MPHRNGQSSEERQVSVAHAIEHFFATLRLAPRSQKAYRIGLRRFAEFVAREAEREIDALPVTSLTIDHVTDFLTTMGFDVPGSIGAYAVDDHRAAIPHDKLANALDSADVLIWSTESEPTIEGREPGGKPTEKMNAKSK